VRTLKKAGADIHTLADSISNGGFTEVEMKKLYDAGHRAGFDAGVRSVEDRHNGFHSVEPSWHEIAAECSAHPDHLRSEREHQFVKDMVRRTVKGGQPTTKQADWLRSIYARVRP
jgi:hypothetical protein